MFRDGHYLEVIKASNNCLATAVVTVQEKTIEIKKKKVSTNKWLNTEDWAALYKILERAILRISQDEQYPHGLEKCEWKKSTRQLDITYTFESSENLKDIASLPTIRVTVSPAKKKSEKTESLEQTSKNERSESENRPLEEIRVRTPERAAEKNSDVMPKKFEVKDGNAKATRKDKSRRYLQCDNFENDALEEYVPDAPSAKKLCPDLKYVPSRKSALERIQVASNTYTPTPTDSGSAAEVIRYIPNPVGTSKTSYEEYEPCAKTGTTDLPEEYVPNSKGIKSSIEEYQPDFTSKSMKFDDSYVPSSVQLIKDDDKKSMEQLENVKAYKHAARRKGDATAKKKMNLFS